MQITPKAIADGIPVWCAHESIVDILKLVPNPKNPNKHPQSQIDLGARIIKANGWRWPIVVSKKSGFITKGHGRLLFAQKLGVQEVPVDYQDYETEADEWADVLADNKLQEFAEPDLDLVKDILDSVEALDADRTGYDYDELLKEVGSVEIPDDDGFDGNPDEVETDIQVGQIFQLGKHRLMCGDATNDLHINQLLGDGEPTLLFTDPPYEFDVTKLFDIFKIINIKHIVLMAGLKQLVACFRNDDLVPKFDIIYVRKNAISTTRPAVGRRPMSDYPQFKHVQLVYFTVGKHNSICERRLARGAFSDGALYPSVVEEDESVSKKQFGYGKDLSAICKIISGFDFNEMLDLFGGSGTFLMACEKMDKTCFAMEVEPKNCQMIIDRWEQATGQKASQVSA
jgi:16S rRNA G966 N2-methylase RsmD